MTRLVRALALAGACLVGELMGTSDASACRPVPSLEASRLPKSGKVVEVIDGDTFTLKGGLQVRLVGMQAPKLSLGRKGFKDWPLADEAKRALEALTLHKTVALFPGETAIDRNGRLLAQVHVASDKTGDEIWVQGEMIETGLARVYTWKDNRVCAPALYAREHVARAARRGIWALPYYAVRKANAIAAGDIDTFQIVSGTVVDVADRGGRIYLNFGTDWRSDFTASVAPDDRAGFTDAADTLARLKGKKVEIRGWLESYNGPMMAFTHPEQLELVQP